MLCRICGTPIKPGERFCSLCGTKAEATEGTYQSQAQQPDNQQPNNQQPYNQQYNSQQPYGQQSYRSEGTRQSYREQESRQSYKTQQYDGQPYGVYSDQPYGQQQRSNMYYSSEPTKSKKWLWITLSLVAVMAVAAVLIFSKPASKPAAAPQGPWPFKGDTIQTKLVNDTFKTYSDSLGILGSGIDIAKLFEQPFDIKADITIKAMGENANGTVGIAYDNETLGMNISTMGTSMKVLLLGDKMYMDTFGEVVGISLNSSADLTKPMPLSDRLIALAFGGNSAQNTLTGNDYITIAELFMNSIDEECFESSPGIMTLTLHAEDVAETLRTFAKDLQENGELKNKIEDFTAYVSETPTDIIKQINDAADSLDKQTGTAGFEVVWEVSYKNEKPVSFVIKADDGGKEYSLSYSYEQNEDSTDVTLDLIPGDSSVAVTELYSYKKRGAGVDFVATTIANGQTQTTSGYVEISGNHIYGTETINTPYLGEETVEFNITVNIGMPAVKVKDDGRFRIDTSGAAIIDGSSMLGTRAIPGAY